MKIRPARKTATLCAAAALAVIGGVVVGSGLYKNHKPRVSELAPATSQAPTDIGTLAPGTNIISLDSKGNPVNITKKIDETVRARLPGAKVQRCDLPKEIRGVIERDASESRQLLEFGENLYYIIESTGVVQAAYHRLSTNPIFTETLSPAEHRVILRLYDGADFNTPELGRTRQAAQPAHNLEKIIKNSITAVERSAYASLLPPNTLKKARENLLAAGSNAGNFARALAAFSDPLEVAAALYRISQMEQEGQGPTIYACRLLPIGSGSGSQMEHAGHNQLVCHSYPQVSDLKSMDAETFYQNIRYAVKARRELACAQSVPAQVWLDYVLPLRTHREPVQPWRRHFFNALAPEVKDMSLEDAARFIHDITVKVSRFVDHTRTRTTPENPGALSLLQIHDHRCEQATTLQNALLRAVGIPSIAIAIPWHAHQNDNHMWTGIPLDGFPAMQGRLYSLMGGEPVGTENPLLRYATTRPAKVITKGLQRDIDITRLFNPNTRTLHLPRPAQNGYVALSVYNKLSWATIAERVLQPGEEFRFPDVGLSKDTLLLITYEHIAKPEDKLGKDIHVAGWPIIAQPDGNMIVCHPNGEKRMVTITDDLAGYKLTPDVNYSFRTWRMREVERDGKRILEGAFLNSGEYKAANGTISAEVELNAVNIIVGLTKGGIPLDIVYSARPFVLTNEGLKRY